MFPLYYCTFRTIANKMEINNWRFILGKPDYGGGNKFMVMYKTWKLQREKKKVGKKHLLLLITDVCNLYVDNFIPRVW